MVAPGVLQNVAPVRSQRHAKTKPLRGCSKCTGLISRRSCNKKDARQSPLSCDHENRMTRRALLQALFVQKLLAQGMATRAVQPQARGKRSGLLFDAKFTDIAQHAGLTAPSIYGSVDSKKHILEAVGCGIAFFDYDHDGWLDILVLGGTRFGPTPDGAGNRLYKNNRDGTFTDVTAKSGFARPGWVSGVTIADYNNDGLDDVFLTYYDQNILFRNNGDGTFTDVTREAGLLMTRPQWSTGCTFVDYDRDGHLDLLVSTYVDFDPSGKMPTGCDWKGVSVHCGPRGLPMGRCYLFHNDGHGRFTDVSKQAGLDASRAYCLTAVAADFDNDAWPDLYVACDSSPSLYFRNRHDGTFVEEGVERLAVFSVLQAERVAQGAVLDEFLGEHARRGVCMRLRALLPQEPARPRSRGLERGPGDGGLAPLAHERPPLHGGGARLRRVRARWRLVA